MFKITAEAKAQLERIRNNAPNDISKEAKYLIAVASLAQVTDKVTEPYTLVIVGDEETGVQLAPGEADKNNEDSWAFDSNGKTGRVVDTGSFEEFMAKNPNATVVKAFFVDYLGDD